MYTEGTAGGKRSGRSRGRTIGKKTGDKIGESLGAAFLAAALCFGMLLNPVRVYAAELPDLPAGTTAGLPASEVFTGVSVLDFTGTVTIRSGESYGVSYEGEESLTPSVTYEEGELLIEAAPETVEETGAGEEEKVQTGEETRSGEDAGSTLCSLLITIPPGTALESVTAEKVDTLLFTDVTIGTVHLSQIRGDICCKNVSLGQGEMYTSEGSIRLDGGAFHNLLLESESGSIYVSAAEGLARCKVAASAEKGSVTVSGAVRGKTFRQNGNGKRYLTISAKEGNVVLQY